MPTLTKKVFLSSTFIDLKEYREAAVHACHRAGLLPVFMENFLPDPRDSVAVCKTKVEEADIFLGLYAHRYGYVPNGSKVSITEMEYDWAIERNLPVYLFIVDSEYPWLPSRMDKDKDVERLERFKARIGKQHTVRKFRDPLSLKEDVLLLCTELAQTKTERAASSDSAPLSPPRVLPAPPEMYSVPPYILTTRFIGRRRELDTLDAWAHSADPMLVVEAIGGVGKSALTWEWARERAPRSLKGHSGTFWWSFYEGGASTASFVREALAYVTRIDPNELRSISSVDQLQLLFSELRRFSYLLVLDGFERLLTAYHRLDPSKLRDEEVPIDHRACTDPKTEDLLRQTMLCAPSKILLTTRLMPSLLQNRARQSFAGVRHLELSGLDPADGEDLLLSLGVHGNSISIRHCLRQFDNHSLLITVLGGRIREYRKAPGDFDRWLADSDAGGSLHLGKLDLKQRRTHILSYAFEGLNPKERQLLSRIAVLSDGADYVTISALNPSLPPRPKVVAEVPDLHDFFAQDYRLSRLRSQIKSSLSPANKSSIQVRIRDLESDLRKQHEQALIAYNESKTKLAAYLESPQYRKAISTFDLALSNLESRGLLQWDRSTNKYDLHPVVRGYAFDRLEESDRIQTYQHVCNYFESLPKEDPERATELADLKNSLQIYRALIGAGQYSQGIDFYRERLSHALLSSIASLPTVIELLKPLFRDGLSKIPPLIGSFQFKKEGHVAADLEIAFSLVGRYEEAASVAKVAIEIDLASEDHQNLAIDLANFSKTLLRQNKLALSVQAMLLAQELHRNVQNQSGVTASYLSLINLFSIEYRWNEVELNLEKLSACPPLGRNFSRVGTPETVLCWARFRQGCLHTKELEDAFATATNRKSPLALANLHELRSELALQENATQQAAEAAKQAIQLRRKAGAHDWYARGCLARSLALQGNHDEARSLVEQVGVPSWQSAEVYLKIGDLGRARECALSAFKEAWADGPPHSYFWELKRSQQLLARLEEAKPDLAPFDASKIGPLPFEAKIRSALEKLKARK